MAVIIDGDLGVDKIKDGSVDLSTDVTGSLDLSTHSTGVLPAANMSMFNYESTSNPAIDTNPSADNTLWLNTSTNEIWVNTNRTAGVNQWKKISYSDTISSATVFDIFGDSSAVALYQFVSGSLGVDTGGSYSMSTVTGSAGTGIIGDCWSSNSNYMKNGNSMNNNLVVSVSCWVKTTDTGNNWIWSSGRYAAGVVKRGLRLQGTTVNVAGFMTEYNGGTNRNLGTITSGAWNHICMSKDKLYINGTLSDTLPTYTDPSSDTFGFYIGTNGAYDYGYLTNETYGQPMNGDIDQMRVFNRELTSTEVATLYAEGS